MSSKSESPNNESVSQGPESLKNDKSKYHSNGICFLCNNKVSKRNWLNHAEGKKHKNNLKKILQRQGNKNNADSNSPHRSNLIKVNTEPKTTQNNANYNEKSQTSSESSSKVNESKETSKIKEPKETAKINEPKETAKVNKPKESSKLKVPNETTKVNEPITTEQLPPKIGATNSNSSNLISPNRRQSMSGQNKPYYEKSHSQSNRGPSQRPRNQQFQDPTGRRLPYHQRYQGPTNQGGYEYEDRNGYPPFDPKYRYFAKHANPNPQDLFFVDSEGAHNQQAYNHDQNYFPFDAAEYPLECLSDCSGEKARSKNSERDSTKPSEELKFPKATPLKRIDQSVRAIRNSSTVSKNSGDSRAEKDSSDGAKVSRSKPPKRINQSVRAIRNASTTSRNSMDSDDSHQDGSSDKHSKKNEGVSGKRIAHWINPSNPKDEAEVRRLVTNFSKSRKKENLVMLKQQSGDRSGEISEPFDADKCLSSPQSEDSSIEILEPSPPKRVISNSKRKNLNLEPDSPISNQSPKANSAKIVARPRASSGELKRKSQSEQPKSKKRLTSSEDLSSILDSVVRGDNVPKMSIDANNILVNNNLNQLFQEINKEPTPVTVMPKKEPVYSIETAPTIQDQLQDFLQGQESTFALSNEATMTPVESLINLFASGNIKVKKEFDDPLIDAIRNLDPAVLNKVCDNQPSLNPTNVASPAQPLPQETCPSPAPVAENPPAKPSPSVTMSLKAILKELEKISKKEKRIKESLQEADQKIQEYQILLDEWKTKKLKIQSEEEILGHQRNTLVKSMNDLVDDDFTIPNFQEDTTSDSSTDRLSPVDTPNAEPCTNSSPVLSSSQSPNSTPQNTLAKEVLSSSASVRKDRVSPVEEEIAILPAPCKSDNIPVIDLAEDPDEHNDIRASLAEDFINDKLSNWKEISAHQVAVNALEVYGGYVYTCSIDGTAKRFDLKDSSKTVTYQHEKKNVTQLCVERINGLTVLFTVCSASLSISAFKAEDGTLLNTLNFQSSVASICRGKDKIYVGLRDGTIFTCNWKDQKEIVNIGDNLRSIALTYQGCISILITLSVNGNVSIRDAERNGLLIRTAKSVKNVPLSMKVHGDCIYLSGSGHVIILEIGTGKCVGQYDIAHPYTSLTPSHGYIFTTSYSGLVRCYSQFGNEVAQVYYGAGNNSLTCICIYNDWVFTGNRFGAVDVFKFNPNSSLPCQVGKCDLVFSREKDLERHILSGTDHDIPSGGSKCAWRSCRQTIPKNCGVEAIKSHIQEHIQALHFQDEQTLFNISL
ncbi:hypothetical protein JTE90_003854 [Oedothorax gibbosus]|uniref:Zinc finger protein 106 n=1 Tax=Oedothorax gibbosus TaxID=931172 RepID=A0AAV6UGK1_9ARAC|nr:hypothetical protein JTE90_003854 [Oedothorax gibbosus]